MKTYGMIYDVDIQYRIIGIKGCKKVTYYYFQASMFHLIKRYLYKGVFIHFFYDEAKSYVKNRREAFLITEVECLFSAPKYLEEPFYYKPVINATLKDFLDSIDNALFVDFELTMPSYNSKGQPFQAEIIQSGLVMVDKNYNEIYKKNMFIRPVINPELNNRTLKFLQYDKTNFENNAIPYYEFYKEFKSVLDEYKPTILVYGKNDILNLEKSFQIHNLFSLKNQMRIVNLNKVIRNFYNLKNDPGLFKLYEIYTSSGLLQIHDALDDASITKEVFRLFYDDVKNEGKLRDKIKNVLEPSIK